jgi:hypothetical protein
MSFLCNMFLYQLLAVLTVIFSRLDMSRLVIWDNCVRFLTKQVGDNRTVEGRITFDGL